MASLLSQLHPAVDAGVTVRPLRIGFIAGDAQTLHCGVKDYAHQLAGALVARGQVAEVHAPEAWDPGTFAAFRRKLRDRRFDVVHVQYPSIGFRYSLLPHLLGFAGVAPVTCVTLHEHTRLPRAQSLSTHLFRISARAILFTTEEERSGFGQGLRDFGAKQRVIPIASNLPIAEPLSRFPGQHDPEDRSVVYFGQLRPDKGLEAFLALARLSAEQGKGYQFLIVGACLPRHAGYLEQMRQGAPANTDWSIGEPLAEVAQTLARSLAAYLPFPDGASFRRGSLLGALVNGAPVIAPVAATTPAELSQVVLAAATAEQALEHLDRLAASPELAASVSEASRRLGRQFSWDAIAEQHELLYRELTSGSRSGNPG